ncbi:hypothetical protein BDZ94DRAFT_1270088 [Collybia nuda]|uniref:Uncharacterized protein n=1 Tax=Collybia nuda TaxID=64659 RepID=A0A9P5XZX5_9AGAR|nr:hypothetical protein BDZ94DRAFT_1270088 [Collybia nuda]
MSKIVLPQLASWTKGHVTAIVEATTAGALDDALKAFLAKDAKITVNGVEVSHDKYKTLIQGEKFQEAGATVAFSGEVQVPSADDPDDFFTAGSVGLFYTAVVSEAIVIHDVPVQRQLTASLNVVIEQDTSIPIPKPPSIPIHGFPIVDRRRVVALNQVITNGPAPRT